MRPFLPSATLLGAAFLLGCQELKMPSLDSVSFDSSGWRLDEEEENMRVWINDDGDALVLEFYPVPPDIPVGLTEVDALRAFHRDLATQSGGALVEFDTVDISGIKSVRWIGKHPQDGTGTRYLGSLGILFRDFGYGLFLNCHEHGVTGIREAVVVNSYLQRALKETGDFPVMDESLLARLASMADDEKYDNQFPEHPLSLDVPSG